MTKYAGRRTIAIEGVSDFAKLVGDAEAGATTVLTRGGVPVVVLSPPARIDAGPHATVAEMACETAAAYAGRSSVTEALPATALLRLIDGSATRAVLGVFMREPDRAVHQREVARRAGVGLRSAQIALERLESLGLIGSERDGNRRYYRAERTPPFEELRALLSRDVGLPATVLRVLAGVSGRIVRAFIFGSVAAGSDTVSSDIDLLVVGDLSKDELVAPIAEAQRELGREIDVVLYRPSDFASKREQRNHFVAAVLAGPRIDLIGGPDDA